MFSYSDLPCLENVLPSAHMGPNSTDFLLFNELYIGVAIRSQHHIFFCSFELRTNQALAYTNFYPVKSVKLWLATVVTAVRKAIIIRVCQVSVLERPFQERLNIPANEILDVLEEKRHLCLRQRLEQ